MVTMWILAGVVMAACLAMIIVLAIRTKRRLGAYPEELTENSSNWFWFVWMGWLMAAWNIPDWAIGIAPVAVVVSGIDLALVVAFGAMAGSAFSQVFRGEWSSLLWYWLVACQLFLIVAARLLYRDARIVASAPWVWVFAVPVAIALAPLIARLLYQQFCPRGRRTEN